MSIKKYIHEHGDNIVKQKYLVIFNISIKKTQTLILHIKLNKNDSKIRGERYIYTLPWIHMGDQPLQKKERLATISL